MPLSAMSLQCGGGRALLRVARTLLDLLFASASRLVLARHVFQDMTTRDLAEVRALLPLSFLRHVEVVDAHDHRAPLGDLAIDIQRDYPVVMGVVVGDGPAVTTRSGGFRLSESGRELHIDDLASARESPAPHEDQEVLLVRDVLDSLVIDLEQRGPARINDIFLEHGAAGLEVKAIDTGVRGIARRLTRGRWPAASESDLRDWRYVVFIHGTPRRPTGNDSCRRIARLPPGEIARLSNALPYLHAAELMGLLPERVGAEVLEVLSPQRQLQVFGELDDVYASRLLAVLAPDTVADLFARLEPEEARKHLRRLPEARRRLVSELLQYPEGTVGAVMTNDVVVLPEGATVSEARRLLRDSLSTPAFVYYAYVVDAPASRRLRGMITLRELLTADPEASLRDAMNPYLTALGPLGPLAPACEEVIDNRVQALPVVGDDGRILGALTADAALAHLAPASWRTRTRHVFS
jgi:magnesium transporter